MDVINIRYANFCALFERYKAEHPHVAAHGSVKKFSEFIETSERQVSFLRTRTRNIGPSTARRIEDVFGLQHGWMDVRHDLQTEPRTLSEQRFIEIMLAIYRKNPELALLRATQMLGDQLSEQAATGRAAAKTRLPMSKRNPN
jgi:plasmid maintenance system antidote protein VapI